MAAGFALLLLFGYAFSWIFAFVALSSSSAEGAQALGFMLIFPLTFASSAFVPPESMPAAIEWFAEINPFSTIVDATRALFVDAPARQRRLGRGGLVRRPDGLLLDALGAPVPARGQLLAAAVTAGWRSAHGCACSSCAATRISRSSRP